MSKKFMSFRNDPLRPMNFDDSTKWQKLKGRSYKLINPDLEKDRQFAYGEIKAVKAMDDSQKLAISGIANANIVDRMMERLDPVGCDIASYLKNSQLLAHHSYFHPIGQVDTIEIQDNGVHFSGWIGDPSKAPLTEMQKEIRSLVAQGILKTVSVGFIPLKVKAPLYTDTGEMTEPCVIEKWELLELSIVAVPCNQDSVFAVRNLEASGNIKQAQQNDESLNDPDESSENSVVKTSELNNAGDLENTNESIEGVTTVAGKEKAEVAPSDTAPADNMQQLNDTCKAMYEVVKQLSAQMDVVIKAVQADSSADSTEPTDAAPAEAPKDVEAAKVLSTRVDKIEKSFDKLVQSVNLLVEKLSK